MNIYQSLHSATEMAIKEDQESQGLLYHCIQVVVSCRITYSLEVFAAPLIQLSIHIAYNLTHIHSSYVMRHSTRLITAAFLPVAYQCQGWKFQKNELARMYSVLGYYRGVTLDGMHWL